MPPSRREQLQLDELLSDIYRGIETLPDKSSSNYVQQSSNKSPANANIYSRTYVKEYELPESSPLVQQHKRNLAAERRQTDQEYIPQDTYRYPTQQPQDTKRSTLKRRTASNTPDQSSRQPQPQSLASFITSPATPESRRRVRIVDHPDKLSKGYDTDDYDEHETRPQYKQQQPQQQHERQGQNLRGQQTGGKVKYVNTNKLIYHQEREPTQNYTDSPDGLNNDEDDDDEQDVDGVTRVEYYHTTWLDRQLGRASKRRSSKELNERQVKEKAMIEELKQSLKNGAITLRQSFKGNKANKHKQYNESFDDQMLNRGERKSDKNRYDRSTVFGSGIATIPRNYNKHRDNNDSERSKQSNYNTLANKYPTGERIYMNREQTESRNYPGPSQTIAAPKQTNPADSYSKLSNYAEQNSNPFDSVYTSEPMQNKYQQLEQANYSKTLPHNLRGSQNQSKSSPHELLQSHYRGNIASLQRNPDMKNSSYANNCYANGRYATSPVKSPVQYNNQLQQQQRNTNETISSIPSATEVVRSALSRSNSQISLNQLNKTINLLPNSPPPYAASPMSPTQNLKASTPSLSPSPFGSPNPNTNCPSPHYNSSTMNPQTQGHQNHQQQIRLTGTRTLEARPAGSPANQKVYANPHNSLMQHKMQQQQQRQPSGSNVASIREFNELDSLLRSLGPSSTTHVSPGYSSKPSQPTFGGYGYTGPATGPSQQQPARPLDNKPVVYAQIQKNAATNEQSKASYLQQNYLANSSSTHQPFTIDVTDKKDDNCLQKQNLSEFEPPIQLLPSMEDYQNISKLNPVRNNYWYKPNMSRDRAIGLLRDKPQGTFIVRDSNSFKGAFGLAVKVSKLPKNVSNNGILRNLNGNPSDELIRHFLIEPTGDGVKLKGYANEPVFSSLANLIYQHSLTELALPCKLVIPRADIEDPKFNQKQKQFYDEFLASKEQAKHNPYEITSPNGGYRRYPGDVYVHNEHRIIFE